MLAHLKARQSLTASDEERAEIKLGLILRLYDRKLEADEGQRWYRLLDWLFPLPRELNRRVTQQLDDLKKEKNMPYVSFAERVGVEKGVLASIEVILKKKYAAEAPGVMASVVKIEDSDLLLRILGAVFDSSSLDEVRALLPT